MDRTTAISSDGLLKVYSAILTVAFASSLVMGVRKADSNASFDQITVPGTSGARWVMF
jgi:hypothetical protein